MSNQITQILLGDLESEILWGISGFNFAVVILLFLIGIAVTIFVWLCLRKAHIRAELSKSNYLACDGKVPSLKYVCGTAT